MGEQRCGEQSAGGKEGHLSTVQECLLGAGRLGQGISEGDKQGGSLGFEASYRNLNLILRVMKNT